MSTHIELGDGSSYQMAESQWKVAALVSDASLHGNGSTVTRLIVRTNDAGEVLVYVEIETPDSIVRMGELLPSGTPGIISAMQTLTSIYGLPPSCFESCLQQLYRK